MPLYPFVCEACDSRFEKLMGANTATAVVECPECASSKTARTFAVPAKVPVSADLPTAAGACGVGPPCGATGCRRISPN